MQENNNSNNNFSPDDGEVSRAYMRDEMTRFPTSVESPNKKTISTSFEVPVGKMANVRDIYNRNYSTETGVQLSHPLEMMTMIVNENNWCDWAVKVIGASCASTDPLFQVFSTAEGRNKSKAANKRVQQIKDKLLFPNLHQIGYELFLTTYENLAAYGNAYWQIVRTKSGEIHSIYTLPPETLRVIPYEDKHGILHCAYYQMDLISMNKKSQKGNVYLEHEIIHFKDTNEKSFLYGKPRLYSLMSHITANADSLTAINSWFSESFSGGAIFSLDGDEDTMARNREFLRDNYSGASNYGKVLVMEGNAKLVNDGQKYIGNVKFSEMASIGRDTILSCMGVPVSMAGVRSDEGMGNAEIVASEEKAFKRNTVDRLHALVFGKIHQKLIREFLDEKEIGILPGTLSKFNITDSINAVRCLSEIGISLEEAREMLGMRRLEVEEMNQLYILKSNNGAIRFEDVLGVDPLTGQRVETLMDKATKAEAEAGTEGESVGSSKKNTKNDVGKKVNEISSGSSGLGGDLKTAVEGK